MSRPGRCLTCRIHTRAIILALGVLLLGLAFVGPVSAQPLSWPPDMDESLCAQYGLTLEKLAAISGGYPNGEWKPYEPVTRAQFAKFAVLAFGLTPLYPVDSSFLDVDKSHVLYPFVEPAAAAGMIQGKGDGRFYPDLPITHGPIRCGQHPIGVQAVPDGLVPRRLHGGVGAQLRLGRALAAPRLHVRR